MKFSKKLSLSGEFNSIFSNATIRSENIYINISIKDSLSNHISGLLQVDTIGQLQWLQTYTLNDSSHLNIQRIIISQPNEIYLCGNVIDNSNKSKGVLLNTNEHGIVNWAFTYYSINDISFNSIIETESSLIICGNENLSNKAILIQANKNGSIQSANRLSAPFSSDFTDILNYSGGLILVGRENNDMTIFEYPFKSDSIKKYQFNNPGNVNSFKRISKMDSNTFIISGYSESSSNIAGDAVLCKWTISEPQKSICKAFGVSNDFEILDLIVDTDSTVNCIGKAEYFGNGIYNGIILLLDKKLNLLQSSVLQNDFNSELHAGLLRNKHRLSFFGIRNDNSPKSELAFGLVDSDSISLCEFQIANIDSSSWANNITNSTSSLENFTVNYQSINVVVENQVFQEISICEEGICKIPIAIKSPTPPYCIGDTLLFTSNLDAVDITWKKNGQAISESKMLEYLFLGDSDVLSLEVFDSLGCYGEDHILLYSNSPKASILGNSNICFNRSEAWYKIDYDPKYKLIYSLENGQILTKNDDSILIHWIRNPRILSVFLQDSFGCKLSVEKKIVDVDSGFLAKPKIKALSEDTAISLTTIDFQLERNPFLFDQEFRLYKIKSDSIHFLTTLIEDEVKWIEPNYLNDSKYYIETDNECGIKLSSDLHQRVELTEESNRIKWNQYQGWTNSSYFLLQNGSYKIELFENEYVLKTIDDLNSCYRILVENMETGYYSFSNELCLNTSVPISVPNIITPNGDNINDRLVVSALEFYPKNSIEIYNRWGKLIFKEKDYRNNWPNVKINNGTYFYKINLTVNEIDEHYKGWIQVLN